jgi:hypothetical protein
MKFGHSEIDGRATKLEPLTSYVPAFATNGMKIDRISASVIVDRVAESAINGLGSVPLRRSML